MHPSGPSAADTHMSLVTADTTVNVKEKLYLEAPMVYQRLLAMVAGWNICVQSVSLVLITGAQQCSFPRSFYWTTV